jgi:hypothetical protein
MIEKYRSEIIASLYAKWLNESHHVKEDRIDDPVRV